MTKWLAVLALALAFVVPTMAQQTPAPIPSQPEDRPTISIYTQHIEGHKGDAPDPIAVEFMKAVNQDLVDITGLPLQEEVQPDTNDIDGPSLVVFFMPADPTADGKPQDVVLIIVLFRTKGKVYPAYIVSAAGKMDASKIAELASDIAEATVQAAMNYTLGSDGDIAPPAKPKSTPAPQVVPTPQPDNSIDKT
jgi:hypothetical protein